MNTIRATIGVAASAAGLSFLAAAGAQTGERVLLDGVAARVNEHVVTVGEVLSGMEPASRQLSARFAGDALKRKLRDEYDGMLNSLIERWLVLDAYEKQKGRLPEWVVDQRIEEVIRDMFDGDRSALMTALARDQISYDEWRQSMQDQLVTSSMRSARVEGATTVAPGNVRAEYEAHADRYRISPAVKVRMIVVSKSAQRPNTAEQRASDALARVKGGEDFGAVARDLSDDGKAAEGGAWGWIDPALLRPELAEAAARLKPGEVSERIDTEEDIYILKVEGKRDGGLQSFDQVQEDIERELRRAAIDKAYRLWVESLKTDAYIRVYDRDVF